MANKTKKRKSFLDKFDGCFDYYKGKGLSNESALLYSLKRIVILPDNKHDVREIKR